MLKWLSKYKMQIARRADQPELSKLKNTLVLSLFKVAKRPLHRNVFIQCACGHKVCRIGFRSGATAGMASTNVQSESVKKRLKYRTTYLDACYERELGPCCGRQERSVTDIVKGSEVETTPKTEAVHAAPGFYML